MSWREDLGEVEILGDDSAGEFGELQNDVEQETLQPLLALL